MNNAQPSPYHIPVLKILPCSPYCREQLYNGSLSKFYNESLSKQSLPKQSLPATALVASWKDNAFLVPSEGNISVTGFGALSPSCFHNVVMSLGNRVCFQLRFKEKCGCSGKYSKCTFNNKKQVFCCRVGNTYVYGSANGKSCTNCHYIESMSTPKLSFFSLTQH